MVQPARKIVRAFPESTIFMECDIQEKMRKHIFGFDSVAHNAKRLAQFSQLLEIPLIATKQVNFGPVAEEITNVHPEGQEVHEKKLFSMLTPAVEEQLRALPSRKNIVLYGLEAHVCIR